MKHLRLGLITGFLSLFTLPLFALELIMVDQSGCVYCELWETEISDIYPKTTEGKYAPLRRLDISQTSSSGLEFMRAVNFTPTFILIEDNTELARIEGYPGEDFFWGLLDMMLRANTGYTGATQ